MTIFKVKKKCYIHSSLIKISWAPISFLIFSNLAEIIDPEYPISFSDLKILKLEGIFYLQSDFFFFNYMCSFLFSNLWSM